MVGILSPGVVVYADGRRAGSAYGTGISAEGLAGAAAGNRKMTPIAKAVAVLRDPEQIESPVQVHYFADLAARSGALTLSVASPHQTTGRPHTYCMIAGAGLPRIRTAD